MATAPVFLTGAGNLTTASNTSSDTITLSKPSNTADGDLLLAGVNFRNTGRGALAEMGWTLFDQSITDNGTGELFWLAVPSASAVTATSWTWTAPPENGPSRNNGFIARITGAHLDMPQDSYGPAVVDLVASEVVTTQTDTLLLYVAVVYGTTVTPTVTPDAAMTERVEQSVNTGTVASVFYVASQTLTAAGGTGTRTATGTDLGSTRCFMIALQPADQDVRNRTLGSGLQVG